MNTLEKMFKLKQNGTNVRTECMAGLTTFMTMSYILIVCPNLLGMTGMDSGAALTVTAVSAFIGTTCMALLANYPFALAPGMGTLAYFTFTVVLQKGYSWNMALTAVFVEGILFIILSLINVREAIFNAIPHNMKMATTVGIGLFIAFIGMQNAGIIVGDESTLVRLGAIKSVPVALALIGTVITVAFCVRKVRGALLWGILITWALGVVCQMTGLYAVGGQAGLPSLIPAGLVALPPSPAPLFMKLEFHKIFTLDFFIVIFSFLFVDLFDTLGTLIGVSAKAGYLDKNGRLPRIKGALTADAIGTTVGACLGAPTVTTYVESASGVTDGGRTGLTAMTTAVLFLLALLFSPVIGAIPSFATTPALIVVGLFMMEQVTQIDFSDYTEGLPAFLTIIMMVVAYSISDGLIFGVLSYVLLKLLSGRARELNPVIVTIGVLFCAKLILG